MACMMPPVRVIVVMGVAGSGKTTVGQSLAADLGWEFRDGDSFHSEQNVAKMRYGDIHEPVPAKLGCCHIP